MQMLSLEFLRIDVILMLSYLLLVVKGIRLSSNKRIAIVLSKECFSMLTGGFFEFQATFLQDQ